MCNYWQKRCGAILIFILVTVGMMQLVTGCGASVGGSPSKETKEFKMSSEYQAVFLDNGQVFFGKLENAGSDYPVLKDVYYVQTRQEPETNQVKSVLIKRGQEWHSPDVMRINSRHIVVIETVSSTSKVARLIRDANVQKPAATP